MNYCGLSDVVFCLWTPSGDQLINSVLQTETKDEFRGKTMWSAVQSSVYSVNLWRQGNQKGPKKNNTCEELLQIFW